MRRVQAQALGAVTVLAATAGIGLAVTGGQSSSSSRPTLASGSSASPSGHATAARSARIVAATPAAATNRAKQATGAGANLSDRAARTRTRDAFPQFVTRKDWLSLEDQPGVDVRRYVGDMAAVVDLGRSRALVRSLLPLRAGDGRAKQPLDTTLTQDGGRLRPKQALNHYSLATDTSDGSTLAFPSSGIRLSLEDTVPTKAVRDGEVVTFPNAYRDASALLKPQPAGAQFAVSVLGRNAPESYGLSLSLQADDRLAATAPEGAGPLKGPDGGAVVMRDGEPVVSISPASFVDARGQSLPVRAQLTDSRIVYHVAHRSSSIAYPGLLDPFVAEDQPYWFGPASGIPPSASNAQDFLGWSFSSSPAGGTTGTSDVSFGGRGLNIFSSSNRTYTARAAGTWTFQAPFVAAFEADGARIIKADFGYTAHVRARNAGSTIVQSIFNRQANAPEGSGKARSQSFADAYIDYTPFFGITNPNSEGILGTSSTYRYRVHCLAICDANYPTLAQQGLGSQGNQVKLSLVQNAGTNIGGGGGYVYMGSSFIYLTELTGPRVTFSGAPSPTTWTKDPFTLTATVNDYGLGPQDASMAFPDPAAGGTPTTVASATQGAPCTGAGVAGPGGSGTGSQNVGDRNHRCTAPLTLSTSSEVLPEGEYDITVNAKDILFNAATGPRTARVRIDRRPPDITATGSLIARSGSSISVGDYPVEMRASDAVPGRATSGLKSMKIVVDDSVVATRNCMTEDCAASLPYTLRPADLPVGAHRFTFEAEDYAGNILTRSHRVKVVRPRPAGSTTVDLFGERMRLRIQGANAGDSTGSTMANIGDINDDGLADYALGAPAASPAGRAGAGAVYVVYGSTRSGELDLASLTAEEGFRIIGANAGDDIGSTLVGVGDVNGDEVPDIAISGVGPRLLGLPLGLLRGSVTVVFGGPRSSGLDLAALGNNGFRIDGPALELSLPAQRRFGAAIAQAETPSGTSMSDLNGDGLSDLLIGAPSESRQARVQSGAAYVVYGKLDNATVNADSIGSSGFRIDGPSAGALFGSAVAFVDDQNADDRPDIAIGAPGRSPAGRSDAGTVTVILGQANPTSTDAASLGTSGYEIRGRTGQRIGRGVQPLGDQNLDTISDIALSGLEAEVVYSSATRTGAVDLAQADGSLRIAPPAGAATDAQVLVTPSTDLDGDITEDLLAVVPTAPSRYWALHGGRGNQTVTLGAISNEDGYVISGSGPPIEALIDVSAQDSQRGAIQAVGLPQAAPRGRAGAGEVLLVRGPDYPSCSDGFTPPAPGRYLVTCDDTGMRTATPIDATPSAPPGAVAAATDRPATGNPWAGTRRVSEIWCTKRSSAICRFTFKNLYIEDVVCSTVTGSCSADLLVHARLLSTNRMFLQAASKARPDDFNVSAAFGVKIEEADEPVMQRLAMRCRVDIDERRDRDCNPNPDLDRERTTFNRGTYSLPRSFLRYGDSPSYRRFYEFAALVRVRNRTPLIDNIFGNDNFKFDPGVSLQSDRFTCKDDPDFIRCLFE